MDNLTFLIYDVEHKKILNWNQVCGSKLQIENSNYLKEHTLIGSIEDVELGGDKVVLILVERDKNLEYKTKFLYTMEQGEELSEFFTNCYDQFGDLIELNIGYVRVVSDECTLKTYEINTVFVEKNKTCSITGIAGTSEYPESSHFKFINKDFQNFLESCKKERKRNEIVGNILERYNYGSNEQLTNKVITKTDNHENTMSTAINDERIYDKNGEKEA